ncbi:hypothetical protein WKW79_33965 [Variovorax robiniae]|uniref:Uncharacterized protein n=1 Tax=Variovorax robiniae TaxID=1836199 RepID=A0ABU8XKI9_9BURK
MKPDNVVNQLRRVLEDTPSHRVAQAAYSTFVDWFTRLTAALEAAGVEHAQAEREAEQLVAAVLASINLGADAMTNAVASSASAARTATRRRASPGAGKNSPAQFRVSGARDANIDRAA